MLADMGEHGLRYEVRRIQNRTGKLQETDMQRKAKTVGRAAPLEHRLKLMQKPIDQFPHNLR